MNEKDASPEPNYQRLDWTYNEMLDTEYVIKRDSLYSFTTLSGRIYERATWNQRVNTNMHDKSTTAT